MKKVYMPFIIGFSSFSMGSVLAANAGSVPVTRTLSSDSSANISSSSSFDACNMHFSYFKNPALSDDEYFKKNHQYRSGLACTRVKHLKHDMMYSKLTTKGAVLVPLIIKLLMTTRIRYRNQFLMLHMWKMGRQIIYFYFRLKAKMHLVLWLLMPWRNLKMER
ncbi:hypothetical protein [Pantoea sp. V108_6]|uniref:hypothetical protein n=1 Tax=Pantoea sp. V108_6 TaxID=3044235 RepID=UPI00249E5BE3|nr:hypothetical protein [Pantoea sp. V108_6]MDI3363340.1 hypothetical protein [Pantoea sp. V108_6]